jgi:hypothetical protein
VKPPGPLVAKVTVPVGVVVSVPLSATVAVQDVPLLTITEEGLQLTVVDVGGSGVTVTVND